VLVVDDVGFYNFITRNAWRRVSAADVPYSLSVIVCSQRPPAVITVTTQYGVTGRRFYHPDIDRVIWTWRSLQVMTCIITRNAWPRRHQAWPLPTAYLDSLCGCRHSDSAQPSIVCVAYTATEL